MGQQPSSNNNSLDIVQELMLNGFAGLRKQHPKQKMFTLGQVSDEVRRQTNLKVVLTLGEMHPAKRLLMEKGLVEDLGCGYDLTEYGIHIQKERSRIAA